MLSVSVMTTNSLEYSMNGENVSDVIVPTFIYPSDERNDRLFEIISFSYYKLNFVKFFVKLSSIYDCLIVIRDHRKLSSTRY